VALDKSYYIHTERNGALADDFTLPDVDAIFSRLRDVDAAVLHFHGGLVSEASGMRMAERLQPEYSDFAHPIFFIWESGLFETWGNNADELIAGLGKIAAEEIFKRLTSVVTKWTVGKLSTPPGLKAAPGMLNLPPDDVHDEEMHKVEEDDIPYAAFEPVSLEEVEEIDEADDQALREELESDSEFVTDVEAIMAAQEFEGADEFKAARPAVVPTETLMDGEVVHEMVGQAAAPGEKGLFSAAYLAKRAAVVLFRVVRRFRAGRDHGVYTTVVEELLRELYLAAVGAETWHTMKKETADTFVGSNGGERRAGELFLHKLAELGDRRPERIVLVGHSTGAVFINNLLDATRKAREEGWLPEDFAYDGVLLLAPACSFSDFARVLPKNGEKPLFLQFRMFTMDDAHERANRLASVAYPRSLLYFVSGVVEREADGRNAFDMPLVGMDRFYARDATRPDAYFELGPEIKAVRDFMLANSRVVWSPTAGEALPGLRSDSISHTGFDDTGTSDGQPVPRATIDSVRHILEKGWD
jgi:hypothetical protein